MMGVEEVMMCRRTTTLAPAASSYKFPGADGILLIFYALGVFYIYIYYAISQVFRLATKQRINAVSYEFVAMKQSELFS